MPVVRVCERDSQGMWQMDSHTALEKACGNIEYVRFLPSHLPAINISDLTAHPRHFERHPRRRQAEVWLFYGISPRKSRFQERTVVLYRECGCIRAGEKAFLTRHEFYRLTSGQLTCRRKAQRRSLRTDKCTRTSGMYEYQAHRRITTGRHKLSTVAES